MGRSRPGRTVGSDVKDVSVASVTVGKTAVGVVPITMLPSSPSRWERSGRTLVSGVEDTFAASGTMAEAAMDVVAMETAGALLTAVALSDAIETAGVALARSAEGAVCGGGILAAASDCSLEVFGTSAGKERVSGDRSGGLATTVVLLKSVDDERDD